jgi:hypothetical protein
MKSNTINFDIPAAVIKEATEALELLNTKLTPYLLTDITQSDLEGYARMGESSQMFVNSIIDCADSNENLVPRYLKLEDAQADKKYFEALKDLSFRIDQIARTIHMNRDLAGIELLDFANDIYGVIRRLNDDGDPAGMAMFQTVKSRYYRPSKKRKDPNT